ncbi:unnamed protein product [Rotaria sp. Silwood2]|nr:unnamed protein product [Rotaria sp. Silwood2]CAF3906953.1 unnamed protein product [Rotaria sp. Silwood2]
MIFQIYVLWFVIGKCNSISSLIPPYTNYTHSIELQTNVADLWWTTDDVKQEIIFELHIQTTGWIALGISPAGGMRGADIAIGWVDSLGKVTIQDRYASGKSKPMIDNTTQDWFALQGREQNGWTAIQFKRLFDTCDNMDYPIKWGTNNLIFAYGLTDPDPSRPDGDITYHNTRRGSRTIPLHSYNDPPSEDKFAGLDNFEWRLNNYLVPSNDTTYHCKIYKTPSGFTIKRHAIAHKILIDSSNLDLVHHLLLYECDPTIIFDDANLPDGFCDDLSDKTELCSSNIATGWAVGGDFILEFPEEAGYPLGGDFPIKYYMIEMHYNNPNLNSGRRDSSGIRFYLSNQLRQHDLGFLTFGTSSNPMALAIPPQVDEFIVDSYCLSNSTRTFPESGITVTSAFPHTHLQGKSVWTKLIRNDTAVQYLFNADAFDFNYQFHNRLPKPIKLYPGDAFATRCMYQTMNKNDITLGGQRTKDEMCLHMFMYYPRMNNMYLCATINHPLAWQKIMNASAPPSYSILRQWLRNLQWTSESTVQWQEFYNNATRLLFYGRSGQFQNQILQGIPTYKDLQPDICPNSTGYQQTFSIVLIFAPFLMKIFYL